MLNDGTRHRNDRLKRLPVAAVTIRWPLGVGYLSRRQLMPRTYLQSFTTPCDANAAVHTGAEYNVIDNGGAENETSGSQHEGPAKSSSHRHCG